jgi:hypothetical protein
MKRTWIFLLIWPAIASSQSFTVFQELFFLSQPPDSYFTGFGIKNDYVVYGSWVGDPPKETLVRSTARAAAQQPLHENTMQYNIESWDTDYRLVGRAQAQVNASLYAQTIRWAKEEAPTLKVGLYSQVPVTDLYAYTSSSLLAAWRAGNDLLQPLADILDYLCPSAYCYYNDSTQYAGYGKAVVVEAKRLAKGKKVYAFVSPQYHPSGDHPDQFVSKEYFAKVLRTIKAAGADGVIIWGGNMAMGKTKSTWDPNAGWWQAVKEFMASNDPKTDVLPGNDSEPTKFTLEQNYPNPFNPTTQIRYGLPHRSRVSLTVYNSIGQTVSELANGEQEAGNHVVQFDGAGLASGVYFYTLRAENFLVTKALTLLK